MVSIQPMQIPQDEDPAYETEIVEMRRVINEDMQTIRDIQRRAIQPGDKDRLNELIEDLNVSKDVYQEKNILCLMLML